MEKLHIRLTEQNLVNDPVGQPYCQLDPQDLPEPLARFVHRRHRAGFLKGVALTSAVGLLAPALVYGVAWAGGGFVRRDQSLGDASPKPIPAVTQEHVTPTPSAIVTPTPTPTFSELVPTPTFSPSVTPTSDQTGLVIKCPTPSGELIKTAPGEGKTVALTFDDGPGGRYDGGLAHIARKKRESYLFLYG